MHQRNAPIHIIILCKPKIGKEICQTFYICNTVIYQYHITIYNWEGGGGNTPKHFGSCQSYNLLNSLVVARRKYLPWLRSDPTIISDSSMYALATDLELTKVLM